jgi:hypothetical protein
MFGAYGKALTASSVTFVSKAALDVGVGARYGVAKPMLAVSGCRTVKKADMVLSHQRYASGIVERRRRCLGYARLRRTPSPSHPHHRRRRLGVPARSSGRGATDGRRRPRAR